MPWHAKPRGDYSLYEQEGIDNVLMMNGFMNEYGFSLEAQSAVIACCGHEGVYNPWRWGLDAPAMSEYLQGYGLFQYTSWSKYVGDSYAMTLEGYAPNLSVDYITDGADPSDGWAQMLYFDTTVPQPGNWFGNMWRDYWNTNPSNPYRLTEEEYIHYRGVQGDVLARWGVEDWVSYQTFKEMNIIEDAVWAFIAGFEGPAWPKYWESACAVARGRVWELISGDTPPDPPSPFKRRKGMPLWMYLRRY